MPSGAFGLNDTGQNAMGRMGEIPNWLYALMQQGLTDSGQSKTLGKQDMDQYTYYLQQMLQNFGQPGAGFFSPTDIKAYGSQVMPGVDTAIQDRLGQLNNLQSQLSKIPTGPQIGDTLYSNLDSEHGYTNDITSILQDMLKGKYGAMSATAAQGNNDFNSILNGSYDAMKEGVNTTYPYLRGLSSNVYSDLGSKSDKTYGDLGASSDALINSLVGDSSGAFSGLLGGADSTFSDLIGQAGSAYDKSTSNLQRLLPGGDLQAAAAARSFAPAMAAAQRRLRTAGVDPNSPEASGILQNVDVARGRSMDDVLAANNTNYIKALNDMQLGKSSAIRDLSLAQLQNKQGLTLGGLQNKQGLQLGGLQNKQGLTESGLKNRQGLDLGGLESEKGLTATQNALMQALTMSQTDKSLQQLLSNMGINMGLQEGQGTQAMQLQDTNYQRNMDIFKQRDQVASLARQLGLQDYQVQNLLSNQFNDANMQGIDLNTQLFNQGTAGLARGQANQMAAASALGNQGQYYTNLGQTQQGAAANNAQNAYGMYSSDLGVESQNAGWLTKLLTSFAAPALSMIPGVGPILGSAAGGVANGVTGGGGGQQGNTSNPSSWFGTLMNFINPSKSGGGTNTATATIPWYTGTGDSSTMAFPWLSGGG